MVNEITPWTRTILAAPGCVVLRHWLMLLEKPGQGMEFIPKDMGMSAHSIQVYVNALNAEGGPRYAVRNGKAPKHKRPLDKPVFVMRVQPAEEK